MVRQSLLPAPGGGRAVRREERKGNLWGRTEKKPRHSILANSFQGPGWRLQILQYLAAYILINRLYRIAVCGEPLSGTLRPASAVFFSSPASRSSYESRCRNAA